MKRKYYYVDSPLYKLVSTARACERHFSLMFKKNFSHLGITQGELCLLDTVVRSPEISQIELARLLFKGRAHITQMLNSLENKGLINRVHEIKNGRHIRRTVLTTKGEKIYEEICDVFITKFQKMRDFFEGKDDDFIKLLGEIREIVTDGENVDFD